MLRSEKMRGRSRVMAFLLALGILIGLGAPAAMADPAPTPQQEAEARKKAADQVADAICKDKLRADKIGLQEKCTSGVSGALQKADDWSGLTADVICAPVGAFHSALGLTCGTVVKSSIGAITKQLNDLYKKFIAEITSATTGAVKKSVDAYKKGASVVEFIKNPGSEFEKIVNLIRDGATAFYGEVLDAALAFGEPDLTASWWRSAYSAAGGVGLLLAAVMVILLLKETAEDRLSSSQAVQGFQFLVGGLVAITFAPPIVVLVQKLTHEMSKGIIEWGGKDALEALTKTAIGTVKVAGMPGGATMGLLVFGLLFLGSALVLFMFLLQGMAVYLVSIAMAIGFGMMAHPRWRSKALRVPMLVVGIMFIKPVMVFALMVLGKMAANWNAFGAVNGEGMQTLTQGLLVILSLFIVGLAPWTLLKFFPVLPDGSEMTPGDMNPVAAVAGAGAGMAMMGYGMNRMTQMSKGGGGGGQSAGAPSGRGGGSSSGGSGSDGPPVGGGSPTNSTGGAAAGGSGGGGSAAAGTIGKGGTTSAGGAGSAAGGATGGAGAAAGGAATGGALLVAAAALKTTEAGVKFAKNAAESSAPDAQQPTGDETRSEMHDRRSWSED